MDEIISHETVADEIVWLEVLSRHRDVIARHRLFGNAFRIGRDYTNRVVIDDPYVAPRHLRIFRDADGAWIAEDLDGTNGLFADRDKRRQTRVVLDGGQIVRIGQTYLRLRHPSDVVPQTRVPERTGRSLAIAIALGAVLLALSGLGLWLGETSEPTVRHYLVPLLTIPLVILAWAGLWAIISRIFSRHARFERHLLIAVGAVLVSWLVEEGGAVLAFAAAWPTIGTYDYIADWVIGAAAIFAHLCAIGPAHLWLKGGLVAALMAVGIAIQSASLFDTRDQVAQRSVRLFPPALRIVPLRDETAFFGDVERLRVQLDRDRRRAPTDEGDSPFDEDDEDEE